MSEQDYNYLEQQRQKVANYTTVCIVLGVIGFFTFIFVIGFFFIFGALLFYAIGVNKMRKNYAYAFKKIVVEDALKNVFTNLTFYPDRGLSKNIIKETDMMMLGNRYSSDDYVSGKYKSVCFQQSDVCIQQVTSDSDGTSTTTYFHGRWMIFEFNKNFRYDLQVRQKGFAYAKKTGGRFSGGYEMDKIEMEDVDFNNLFNTFAVNEHEAYYILTPQMMQSLKNLTSYTKGKLLLCFTKNHLHVAVNSGNNAFEPKIYSKTNMDTINNQIYGEINVITRFIDELQLNKDIFKT